MPRFARGGTSFPLVAGPGRDILRDADPTIYWALDFFAEMLRIHLGERWSFVADARTPSPIGSTSPYDPLPFLSQNTGARFPMLSVYRTRSQPGQKTVSKRRTTSTLMVTYVLPPVTAAQAEKLTPMLHAASAVLDYAAESGSDEEYQPPGGALGDSIFVMGRCPIEDMVFTSFEHGMISGIGDMPFPALRGTLTVTEMVTPDTSGLDDYEGSTDATSVGDDNLDSDTDDFVVTTENEYPAAG